ncbi:hypothetical protein [Enterococcus pallens]|uniref:Uncharacterized protein n=1 Tax=Enterococcus pallens ATCC BAA-351 TaxID=1158607 RepID=R2SLE1_9ENTE|nr:hypothetical protein [Enterococcus pallens]EOH93696.1 hypothetical protein UAU_02392 [Enterococcus pallens ATCC BAA-351]EOU24536.1 hypothetical protein I588_00523 [Enterococcus pallens ATCC BAA-351]OJG78578.1 hypothetical protein RV10_GL001360 [Enterococcus pallens]
MTPQKTIPKSTYKNAELYRYKLQLEDEIKANPLSELSRQFYKSMIRPYVEKEPEIPP